MEGDVIRVGVRVSQDAAEAARARLLEVVPGGFEEIDRGAVVELVAYVEDAAAALACFPGATVERVADGWEDRWKEFHRPVVAGGLWIGPPWETPPDDRPAVVIDPGRAFGTGAHATTRLCVELLSRCARGSLLDVGCGSGVLAIAASRLGFAPITAIDDDPVAIAAAEENLRENGVVGKAIVLDALADDLPRADVAVANVLLRPVEAILARLDGVGEVVTSGYRAGERPAHPGWSHLESLEADDWAADRFARPSVYSRCP